MIKILSKRAVMAIIVLVVVVAGAAGWWLYRDHKQADGRYVTVTASRGDVVQAVSATGTINPVQIINVGTQISGVVRIINVDFNDRVAKGQVLAELDQALIQAQLKQSQGSLESAEAALRLANADYERSRSLRKQEYISQAEMDTARQKKEAAEAQVTTAQGQVERDTVNLGYSVVTSPVAGVIISRDVDVGQTVAASFQTPTLFKIAEDLSKMQIDTSFSEADIGGIIPNSPVRFTVDAFPGRTFTGTVRQVRLNPTTVQNVVTYNVVVDFANTDLTLLPGMTAFVTLDLQRSDDVIRVPNSVFSFRPVETASDSDKRGKIEAGKSTGKRVFVLTDNIPTPTRVVTGITDGTFTEVREGLTEGAVLIIQDTEALKAKSSSFSLGGGGMRP